MVNWYPLLAISVNYNKVIKKYEKKSVQLKIFSRYNS